MEKVLEQFDRARLVEITKNLADIVSLTGEEKPLAEYLGREFERLGMEVNYQEVEEGRPNVIGTLKGSGEGATLMFCGHMDHFDNPHPTMVKDDRVYGRGLVNMKCAFPCYLAAVEMLVKAKVRLKGDIIISGVVGEIEKAPVGRFTGKRYRGGGVGARYMMDHGVTADMCIIGEPTGLSLQIGNAGLVWAQVRVEGKAMNFVLKALEVARGIQNWETEYQKKYPHPFMLPTVQIGAVEGGNPFKPGTQPATNLYVIVKTLPGTPPNEDQEGVGRGLRQNGEARGRHQDKGGAVSFDGWLRDFKGRAPREGDGRGAQGGHREGDPVCLSPPLRYLERRLQDRAIRCPGVNLRPRIWHAPDRPG